MTIVSGLALGCDTLAHEGYLKSKGKTVAILPSQINKVVPAKNKELTSQIINEGDLLISEYYKDPNSRYEAIDRFIERDRLQVGLNKDLLEIATQNQVKILVSNSIEEIKNFQNPNLILKNNSTTDDK